MLTTEHIEQVLLRHKLLNPQDVVIVAVSGGPDSMALLHVLYRLALAWQLELVVAHVDHGFRGQISASEAEGVQALAKQWGLAAEVVTMNLPAHIERTGDNAQDAARQLRYKFLLQVAKQYKARWIALGHHADDQAETVLMNAIRGTGLDGLKGIPLRRSLGEGVELIRPLLEITKEEIVQYCKQQGLLYYEDLSNETRDYFRNQVRLDVIPYLKQYNPQLVSSLNRMADAVSADNDYVQLETEQLFHKLIKNVVGNYSFSRISFLPVHVALQRRLIKLILNYLSPNRRRFDFRMIEMIREAILVQAPSTTQLDIGDGVALVREYDHVALRVSPEEPFREFAYLVHCVPHKIQIKELQAVMEFTQLEHCDDQKLIDDLPLTEAYFDLSSISFPLTVRNRRAGDRIQLPGLNGTKKIKDLWIDQKIPPSQRERIPLVVDAQGRVLWIPGMRRSTTSKLHSNTSQMLHITYQELIQ